MNILEAIIGFPFVLQPGQAIGQLDIKCLAVEYLRSSQIAMMNVSKFRKEFGSLLSPHHIGRRDQFVKIVSRLRSELVAID